MRGPLTWKVVWARWLKAQDKVVSEEEVSDLPGSRHYD